MAEYYWPENHKSRLIGKRINRLDGMEKSNGTAKYTYDVNLPKQLIVHALGCPHSHCRVISVDTSAAEKVPGVVLVHFIKAPGPGKDPVEIRSDGTLLVAVAAESEAAAAEEDPLVRRAAVVSLRGRSSSERSCFLRHMEERHSDLRFTCEWLRAA